MQTTLRTPRLVRHHHIHTTAREGHVLSGIFVKKTSGKWNILWILTPVADWITFMVDVKMNILVHKCKYK